VAEVRVPGRGELLAAFAIPFVAALGFWNKAVHQDDWAYLRVAELLVQHGGDVLSQSTTYQGLPITVETGVMHGPVWLWVLAGARALGGAAHQIGLAHLVSALCLGALGFAVASLAARFGARPLPTALALALAPAPLVLAGGLMTDLPMVALFACSMALAVRGLERGARLELAAAGVLAVLSGLTRYHGLAAIPLLAVLPLMWPGLTRSQRLRGAIPALVAFAGAALYLGLAFAATGGSEVARAKDGLDFARIDHGACLLAAVAALGGVGIGLFLGPLAAPRRVLEALRRAPRILLVAAAAAAMAFAVWGWRATKVRPELLHNALLHHAVFAFGALALVIALWPFVPTLRIGFAAWRERRGQSAWLSLWLLGFVVAAWFTLPFGATRYALPALPALFLIGGTLLAHLPARAAWAAAGLSAVLGVLAAGADHRAAALYPRIGVETAARIAPGGPWHGSNTWIWGELGFRWYLELLAGLEVLPTASNAPREGDRILKSMVLATASPDDGSSGRYRLHPGVVQRIQSESVVEFPDPWPVRIHHSYAGAGFYGADAGFLPFAFASPPHDRLQVWKVGGANPFVDGLGGAQIFASPGGFVRAQRFLVAMDEPQHMAIEILLPGRATFRGVVIPSGAPRFACLVGEHHRLTFEQVAGPATLLRVWVGDAVVAEQRIDTRAGDRKTWYPLEADLSAYAGQVVELAFEVVSDPANATGPDGSPPRIYGGFAEARIETR